VKPKF